MTVPGYKPQNTHDALARLAEECNELGMAVCKAIRFGVYNYHPKTKVANMDSILGEFADIADAMNDFLVLLNDVNYPAPQRTKGTDNG